MRIRVINSLAEIPAISWNRLAGEQNPFVQYEFLSALETSGCVKPETGWQPQHMLLEQEDGAIAAATPLYLKTHSYGEYVFDWAWADAYERSGYAYYPKLVAAVPFSPVTGPRVLAINPKPEQVVQMGQGAQALAIELGASSMHWLFTTPETTSVLANSGYLQRTGFQYHWQNNDYSNFDEFLNEFSSDKRKKIRRERRRVRDQGIRMEILEGDTIEPRHWDQFYRFYRSTILNHGAIAYLNPDFFYQIGESMRKNIVLVFAYHEQRCVAGALNLKDADCLYGRYWGCDLHFDSLHFETCYYSAIDYCITSNLRRFEAGAQGGHKLSRGFLPTPTWSTHWLRHAEFSDAVERYLKQEQNGIEYQMNELNEHTPFKRHC